MGAKEIMARKFEMVLRGYKTEEVEEFLREVSLNFSRLQKENEELEEKMTVLADKIREYREDEDTLKDALLGAQRQGNALIADSKRKAAEIIEEAQNGAAAVAQKSEEERLEKKRLGDDEIAAAKQKASDIIDAANDKAKEIEREMNLRTDVQKEVLHRTAEEVSSYKTRIIDYYKKERDVIEEHRKKQMEVIEKQFGDEIAFIEKIADECENEFVKGALKEGRPNLAVYKAAPSSVLATVPAVSPRTRKSKDGTGAVPKAPKFETTDISAKNSGSVRRAASNQGGAKFDIDGDDYSEGGVPDKIFADDTGEVPFFNAPKIDHKQTNEIFFNKPKR